MSGNDRLRREIESLLRWTRRGTVSDRMRGAVLGMRTSALAFDAALGVVPVVIDMDHGWYYYPTKWVTPPDGAPEAYPADFPAALPLVVPDVACFAAEIDLEPHESPHARLSNYLRTAQYSGLARLWDQALRGVGRSIETTLVDMVAYGWNHQANGIGLVRLPNWQFWAIYLRETRTGTAASAARLEIPAAMQCVLDRLDDAQYPAAKKPLLFTYLLSSLELARDSEDDPIWQEIGDCSGVRDYIQEIFDPSNAPWSSLGWGWCFTEQRIGGEDEDLAKALIVLHRYKDEPYYGSGAYSLEWKVCRVEFSEPGEGESSCGGIKMSDPAEDQETGFFPHLMSGHTVTLMNVNMNNSTIARTLFGATCYPPQGTSPTPEVGVVAAYYGPGGEELRVELQGNITCDPGSSPPDQNLCGLEVGGTATVSGVAASSCTGSQVMDIAGDSIAWVNASGSGSGGWTFTCTQVQELWNGIRYASHFDISGGSSSSSMFPTDSAQNVFIDVRWPGVAWRTWDEGMSWATSQTTYSAADESIDCGSALATIRAMDDAGPPYAITTSDGGAANDPLCSVHVGADRYDVDSESGLRDQLLTIKTAVGGSRTNVVVSFLPTGPRSAVGYFGRLAVDGAPLDAPEAHASSRTSGWVGAS